MTMRAFVSSVMTGFSAMREAARAGVTAARCVPVMAEDFGAQPNQPRSACLDAVRSANVLVLIVGERRGFEAPSGKSVVEEEFDEARRRGKTILVFVQHGVRREPELQTFVEAVSSYVGGWFYATFVTPDDLSQAITKALSQAIRNTEGKRSMTPEHFQTQLLRFDRDQRTDPVVRVFVAPTLIEILDEWIDEKQLRLYLGLAHQSDLFTYDLGSQHRASADNIQIWQQVDRSNVPTTRAVVSETGTMMADTRLIGKRQAGALAGFDFMLLNARDILERSIAATRFYCNVLAALDPHLALSSFHFNVAIASYGARTIEWDPPPRSSWNIPTGGDEAPVAAWNIPKLVTRQQFADTDALVEPAVRKLVQRVQDLRHSKTQS
jgi:hypothetical protein